MPVWGEEEKRLVDGLKALLTERDEQYGGVATLRNCKTLASKKKRRQDDSDDGADSGAEEEEEEEEKVVEKKQEKKTEKKTEKQEKKQVKKESAKSNNGKQAPSKQESGTATYFIAVAVVALIMSLALTFVVLHCNDIPACRPWLDTVCPHVKPLCENLNLRYWRK